MRVTSEGTIPDCPHLDRAHPNWGAVEEPKTGWQFVFFILGKPCQIVATGWREKGVTGDPPL